jgi:hypothetical protein
VAVLLGESDDVMARRELMEVATLDSGRSQVVMESLLKCVISGIRPQIAQTIVHLGIDLGEITTRATLSGALKYALTRTGARLGTGG